MRIKIGLTVSSSWASLCIVLPDDSVGFSALLSASMVSVGLVMPSGGLKKKNVAQTCIISYSVAVLKQFQIRAITCPKTFQIIVLKAKELTESKTKISG